MAGRVRLGGRDRSVRRGDAQHGHLQYLYATAGDSDMSIEAGKILASQDTEPERAPLRRSNGARWSVGEVVVMAVIAVAFRLGAFPVLYALLKAFRQYAECQLDAL